jgi:hypothetical protein
MNYYKFSCPHCKQHLDVPEDLLGVEMECPTCEGLLTLPALSTMQAAFEAADPAVQTPPPLSQKPEVCPLCGDAKHMEKARPLYGHRVCKKCYYGFANQRQLAFFLDTITWRVILFPVGFAIGAAMAISGSSPSAISAAGNALGWLLLPIFCCKDGFAGQS